MFEIKIEIRYFYFDDLNQGYHKNPSYDVYVVELISISDLNATFKNPPKLTFKIQERLIGSKDIGNEFTSVWEPPVRFDDYIDNDYYKPLKDEWYQKTYEYPKINNKFVIFVREGISVVQILTYSDEIKNEIIKTGTPRRGNFQIIIFVLILLTSIISFGFLIYSYKKKIRKTLIVALVLSAFSFIIYVYYENGVSIYAAIRVDLLLIIPSLIISLIVFILSVILMKDKNQNINNEANVE